jgi:hypothetical protein
MRLARLLLIGSFLLLIALPGLQMRCRFVPEMPLSGVRVEPDRPSLSLRTWWEGEFQSQAEDWFDDHAGFRGYAVRTDNQIGLSLFREASSHAVDSPVLGRRMMLYGDNYVRAYDGIDGFSDLRLRKRARALGRLQRALARRGIAFVFLISPNKASIYPEYLPPGVVRPDGQRPPNAYERMLPLLRSEGVQVVDGHVLFAEEKARSPHALFPPGGFHWNRYGASLVLRRAWQRLGQQIGRPLVDLRWRAVLEDDTPARSDQETDGADLLNAWHVGHADWRFPRPDLFTDEGGDAFRPRLVVVGDSFWWVPAAIIAEQRLASRSEFLYYYNELERRRAPNEPIVARPGGLVPGMSWEYIFSADAVIVETNEAGLGDAGWGFVEQAEHALSGAASRREAAGGAN